MHNYGWYRQVMFQEDEIKPNPQPFYSCKKHIYHEGYRNLYMAPDGSLKTASVYRNLNQKNYRMMLTCFAFRKLLSLLRNVKLTCNDTTKLSLWYHIDNCFFKISSQNIALPVHIVTYSCSCAQSHKLSTFLHNLNCLK